MQDGLLHSSLDTQGLRNHASFCGARKVDALLEARFGLKNNIGIFPGAGDFQGKVLRESRAGHLMVPLLPDSPLEFHDSFVPSETAGPLVFSTKVMSEAFSVKRLPGSRTIRDLMITSGRGSFQRLHRTFRRLRQKKATANEQDCQVEEEMMENDVMDAEGSLREKPREVCITKDTESIDLGWFENTKLKHVRKRASSYRLVFAIGNHWAHLRR